MQNGRCSFTNSINQYNFFFIVFRLYVPFKTFWERKCEFPCVFHWTSQDVSQINDEFIFTIPSGKKDALVFTNFQVKNWGRERFKALKIHWFEGPPCLQCLAWIFSCWISALGLWKIHRNVYIHDMFPKAISCSCNWISRPSTRLSLNLHFPTALPQTEETALVRGLRSKTYKIFLIAYYIAGILWQGQGKKKKTNKPNKTNLQGKFQLSWPWSLGLPYIKWRTWMDQLSLFVGALCFWVCPSSSTIISKSPFSHLIPDTASLLPNFIFCCKTQMYYRFQNKKSC